MRASLPPFTDDELSGVGPAKVTDELDVVRLREHIVSLHLDKLVPAVQQATDVPGEGGGIAGDGGDVRGFQVNEGIDHLWSGT